MAVNKTPRLSYRLAAINLDDTLLGPDRAVSPGNTAAVRWLRASGLTVVLASGRRLASTCRFHEPLGLADLVICYNAAPAYWPARDEIMHHLRVPSEAERFRRQFP